jgi:ATP-dependent RNA helicase DeaD
MRDELKGVLENGILSRETVALEPLLEEYDAVEIAAAALRLLEQHRAARAAQPSAASSATPVRDRSAPSGDPTKTKLFMTIGEQDGVRAGDIVGAVAGETGLPGSVIGRIEIRDKHSLIEVDSEHAADVIRKMNGLQIRGRKIAVREERERPPRGDRPDRGERSTRGDRPDRGERRPDRGDRGDRRPPRRDAGERRPNRDDRGNRGERGDRPRSSDHRKRMP